MRRRTVGWAAAGILATVVVGACSGGDGHRGGSSGGSAGGSLSGPAASAQRAQSASGAAQGPHGKTAGGTAADDSAPLLPEAKIRTVQMSVTVSGPRAVATQSAAAGDIAEAAGGEVDSESRTTGTGATATLQLRVPPDTLPSVLDRLGRLGTERSRELSTVDVSEKVADVDSRVASARQAIARLRTLYASATKVGEILAVEGELGSREADLEALEAQQRTLARQTAMARIDLTLEPRATPPPPAHHHTDRGGFVGGLQRGWDGFVAAASWLAGALGTVLPFLLLALVLAGAGRLAWRRLPRRPTPPAPTPAE